MVATISIGTKVTAAVGPFLASTRPPSESGRAARHSRERYTGIVIKSLPNQHWTVYWTNIGYCSSHSCKLLKYVTNATVSEYSDNKPYYLGMLRTKNLQNQAGLD